jgi:hypothetical protein
MAKPTTPTSAITTTAASQRNEDSGRTQTRRMRRSNALAVLDEVIAARETLMASMRRAVAASV